MKPQDLHLNYDLCVIGGGINGAGIARDAAGRGLSVLLVEARDLAQATSSASTKLIHGGLRYLEYFEFHMVRESLKERERLLKIAPHIIWPMDFILPHDSSQRPWWLIRLGLFLYDNLTRRKYLPSSRGVDFRIDTSGLVLKNEFIKGFQYSDCWVEDSRLVVLNAMSAADKGAHIITHTTCTKLAEEKEGWRVGLKFKDGKTTDIFAGAVINAAGPWVRDVLEGSNLAQAGTPNVRLVKGSHIIIKRAHEGEHAYILQQPGGRIIFVIPYERDYTLIGTTEEDFEGDTYDARISNEEMDYLCNAYNRAFEKKISRNDLLWTYSGVRPLFDDGDENATSITRDYKIYKQPETIYPMFSVFGGKLTTYRVVAEDVVNKVMEYHEYDPGGWTASEHLPGGAIPDADFDAFIAEKMELYSWLKADVLRRYARSYGTRIDLIIGKAKSPKGLGEHYGDGLYKSEVTYLIEHEWARSVEDILFRRSKLGLHVSDKTVQNLEKALPKLLKEHANE